MDFLGRFARSQRYSSTVPLTSISFHIVISRSLIVEEGFVEVMVDKMVHYNEKCLSPMEKIELWKKMRVALRTHAGKQSDERGDVEGEVAPLIACPSPSALYAALKDPSAQLFTRPSGEDFIDAFQEECPVLPPQGDSLLAPVVLRGHRREHLPNRNFYVMWSDGAPSATWEGEDSSAAGAESDDMDVGGEAKDDSISWTGSEQVVCTITTEQSGLHQFTTKPTLLEEHTLLIDASHIYRFRIVPVVLAAGGAVNDVATKLEDCTLRASYISSGVGLSGSSPLSIALPKEMMHGNESHHPNTTSCMPPDSPHPSPIGRASDAGAGGLPSSSTQPLTLSMSKELLRAVAKTVPAAATTASATAANGRAPMSAKWVAGASAGATASGGGGHPNHSELSGTESPNTSLSAIEGSMTFTHRAVRFTSPLARSTYLCVAFGTVERCVGIAESTVFVRGEITRDAVPGAGSEGGNVAASSSSFPQADRSENSEIRQNFCSQLAHVSTVYELDYTVAEPEHVFNLPFEISYREVAALSTSSPHTASLPHLLPLRLKLAFYTEGYGGSGVQSVVGYACVNLPIGNPGSHLLRCSIWAIHPSAREALKSSITGGAPSFINLAQAGPLPGGTGIGVKAGLVTDSIGYAYVRVNVASQKVDMLQR